MERFRVLCRVGKTSGSYADCRRCCLQAFLKGASYSAAKSSKNTEKTMNGSDRYCENAAFHEQDEGVCSFAEAESKNPLQHRNQCKLARLGQSYEN